ncbi:hypothetical protein THASP1DRAFT_21358 [Thamnocephalis sphaerospora]|uniref:RING-type domain-containing protein n=1 Tax=Thamnocephalis sphaerospora TaxID=78915 RepID=A0A4P9XZ63_9FUNG|nr:hypothetical protein THASP1DRAFT_21358 [Thamnocephalis sphaerospora]|eukprot:RKP11031.1 hypothetical protein THASP1DRAFT_21358 [Thamnocephalis sphaerospora]
MTRHSKNNTASSFFTSAEREKLKYGTQKQRLGRDSMRDYDACFLCLQTARDPLCCPKGHLACKECFYENILAQKREIARTLKLAESQQKAEQEQEQDKLLQAQQALLREFERTQTHVNAGARHTAAASTAEQLSGGGEQQALRMNPKDIAARQQKELKHALASLDQETLEKTKSQLSSFWIPHLTPEAKQAAVDVSKKQPVCSASADRHILRQVVQQLLSTITPSNDVPGLAHGIGYSLKKLIPVHFASSLDGKDDEREDDTVRTVQERRQAFFCPACSKNLSNTMKMSLSRNCGHVLCSRCMDQFVRKSQRCFVCEKKCKDKDIIQLATEGTGFAAGGGQVEVAKYDTAFLG